MPLPSVPSSSASRVAGEPRLIRPSFSWLSFFNEGADHGDLIYSRSRFAKYREAQITISAHDSGRCNLVHLGYQGVPLFAPQDLTRKRPPLLEKDVAEFF